MFSDALLSAINVVFCYVLMQYPFIMCGPLLQMVASLSHGWSRGELVLWPLSRILLLPLIIMCAAPRHKPVFRGTVNIYF
jgi:hypothetical protein